MTKKKPYIQLNEDLPGITSLFAYDKEVGSNLTALAQTIMRRKRGLTPGERETIAAYVSQINRCEFCYKSHKVCAEQLGSKVDWLAHFGTPHEQHSDLLIQIPKKLQYLLIIAKDVSLLPNEDKLPNGESFLTVDIKDAKDEGATDEEIHDTVLVSAFFSMCNRYVDGLGTTYKKGEPEEGGRRLAKNGYVQDVNKT